MAIFNLKRIKSSRLNYLKVGKCLRWKEESDYSDLNRQKFSAREVICWNSRLHHSNSGPSKIFKIFFFIFRLGHGIMGLMFSLLENVCIKEPLPLSDKKTVKGWKCFEKLTDSDLNLWTVVEKKRFQIPWFSFNSNQAKMHLYTFGMW